MRTTSATPGRPARFKVAAKRSMSPLSPMIVRDSPRLTNASPPASRTTLTTWSTSDAVASAAITTTIGAPISRGTTPQPGCSLPAATVRPPPLAGRPKFLKRSDVPRVPRLPAGRLHDEGDVGQGPEQLAERCRADHARADRLVPVALGPAAEQRVVGVHQLHA